jgi:hypothetical protein
MAAHSPTARDLRAFAGDCRFGTVLADPPWRFQHRGGKVAPVHGRGTLRNECLDLRWRTPSVRTWRSAVCHPWSHRRAVA